MAIDLAFRRKAVRTLTNKIGCYVLCDLDQVPIYVGQSVDSIRSRVNSHLTSAQKVQVMIDAEIAEKKDPALRLPRQAEHYSQIVRHFLAVKNSKEIAGAIQAHFERLQKYHRQLLGLAIEIEGDSGDD